MNKLKMLFLQTSFISLGIFLAVGISQTVMHFFGNTYATDWYFIISVILAGVLCSLPSLVLFTDKLKPFFVRILIQFVLVFAAVSLLGWLFKWYSDVISYAVVILIFVFVYIFVWVVTKWFYVKEDKEINNALDSIRDEE
ncbi:MAG: DUF3021 domain-containing protein [Lachnospiraceae bacterium]|nr:DUF3021 domain-containing protein [Lachnospiraceae bacterium]